MGSRPFLRSYDSNNAQFPFAHLIFDIVFVVLDSVLLFYVWADFLSSNHGAAHSQPLHGGYLAFLLAYMGLITLSLHAQGFYSGKRRSTYDESVAIAKAMLLATIFLSFFVFTSGSKSVSRLLVGMDATLITFTLIVWRVVRRRLVRARIAEGHGTRNILIVGAGKVGQTLARYFEDDKDLGYVVKGFLDCNSSNRTDRMLGDIEDLHRIVRAHFIDDVFITIPSEREIVKKVALAARRDHVNVKVVPELYDGLAWKASIENAGEFTIMALHGEPIPALGVLIKRALDIFLSAIALVLLSPAIMLIAFLIKLDSPGPAFYNAPRLGYKGRPFPCYKFRTMVTDAELLKEALRNRNERAGPFFKMKDDPRITRFGRWLRKTGLDELPQLLNVLRGEMSLVGPRPHPLDDCAKYSLEDLRRLDVHPGITGLWQIYGRTSPAFETSMKLDSAYIETWSLALDAKLLLLTIPTVLRRTGY